MLLTMPAADWARAQERPAIGPPLLLRPGGADRPATAPPDRSLPDAGPVAPGAPAAPSADTAPGTVLGDGIVVERLQAVDPSSAGILDKAQGGFGADLWSGTPLALVESLLPRMPVATTSATMQSLSSRLLLSSARVPEGDPQGPSLLALRMERLAQTGQLNEIKALLQVASPNLTDVALYRVRLETALLSGDDGLACSVAERLVAADAAAEWQKAMAYCAAIRDDTARAALYEQLLRESGHQDKAFSALLDAMLGRQPFSLDSLPAPTALHLAMLRQVGAAVPSDAVDGASPMVLAALATAPGASPELRLEAAERAAVIGALPTQALRQVYDSVSISPRDVSEALERARKTPGPRTNALLYQVARAASAPKDRAGTIQLALENGRRLGRYATQAQVHGALLQEIEPQPSFAWFAADAGRALLAAHRPDSAFEWFMMAQSTADEAHPQAATAVLTLWPLMQVADAGNRLPYRPEITRLWWQGQTALGDPARFKRAILLAVLLEALDYEVPSDVWAAFRAASTSSMETVPSPMLRQGLIQASEAGRLGETVLFALINLGSGGPAEAAPSTLSQVAKALSRVGLKADARQIALEALLAHGF